MSSIKKVLCIKAKNNQDRTFTPGKIYDVSYYNGFHKAVDDNGYLACLIIEGGCIYGEWQPLEQYMCMTSMYQPTLNIGDIVTGYVAGGVLHIPDGINSKQFSYIEGFKKLNEMNSEKPRHEVRHVIYDTKDNKIVNDAMGECYITLAEAHEVCDEMNAPKVMKTKYIKEVEYFGVRLLVREDAKFIATSKQGVILTTSGVFTLSEMCQSWVSYSGTLDCISKVDLNGIDWKDTLVEIK